MDYEHKIIIQTGVAEDDAQHIADMESQGWEVMDNWFIRRLPPPPVVPTEPEAP